MIHDVVQNHVVALVSTGEVLLVCCFLGHPALHVFETRDHKGGPSPLRHKCYNVRHAIRCKVAKQARVLRDRKMASRLGTDRSIGLRPAPV